MDGLRDKLIQANQDNRFLGTVYELSRQDRDGVANALIDLHNTSTIDIVEAFSTLRNSRGKVDFFLTRRLLERALPELDADVLRVMKCVIHLIEEAGQDLAAAGTVIDSYIEFCAKTPSRPHEAIGLIENNTRTLMDLLAPTLIAGARHDIILYTQKALGFAKAPDLEVRKRAVFCLGRIQYHTNDGLADTSMKCITETVDIEDDDHLLGNAIDAAFKIYTQHTSLVDEIPPIFDKALKKGSAITINAASGIFGRSANKVTPSLLKILTTHLTNVHPEHTNTLNCIDLGLETLLSGERSDTGIAFLEKLLTAGKIKMEAFNSVAHLLSENKRNLLARLTTRWFLDGDQALCLALHQIIRSSHNDNLILNVAPDELMHTDLAHLIFLAKKAIGYFFFWPVTATSFLLSLLTLSEDEQTASAIAELIFEFLLLNYPGQARDYLEEQRLADNARIRAASSHAIQAYEEYVQAIMSAATLSEHRPPMTHWEAFRAYHSRQMHQSMREAEKHSIFRQLANTSILLYGTQSAHYIGEPNGQQRRMEMSLQEHSVSMEMPRLHNIDPVGLDCMLRVFKHEKISA